MGEWNSSAYLMHRSCLGCKYYNFIKSRLIPALLISCTHKKYNAVFTHYIKIHTHRIIINPSASPRRVQMYFIWNFQHMGGVVLPLGSLALIDKEADDISYFPDCPKFSDKRQSKLYKLEQEG